MDSSSPTRCDVRIEPCLTLTQLTFPFVESSSTTSSPGRSLTGPISLQWTHCELNHGGSVWKDSNAPPQSPWKKLPHWNASFLAKPHATSQRVSSYLRACSSELILISLRNVESFTSFRLSGTIPDWFQTKRLNVVYVCPMQRRPL